MARKDKEARAAWREKIRAAGLRSTSPRIEVLLQLQASRAPLSHGDLVESMSGQGFDRATLFRNLNDLSDAGLVAKRDLGDHTWRFELRKDSAPSGEHDLGHPHFTCIDCGAVSCLPDESVGLKAGRGVPRSVVQRNVRVTLQGLCDRCA
jgi:Fur family ferric uptake transcriptional regulator